MQEVANAVTIPLPISAGVLWLALLLAIAGCCLASWVLLHHWNYYGIAGNNRVFAKSLYFVVSVALLVAMALFIGGYSVIS